MSVPREMVTAVILTGGRSTRMGRDKASLVPDPADGRTLARIVLDSLAPVAAHALQAGPAVDDLPGVAAIDDQNPGAGPLAAIAQALPLVRPRNFAVVAACDMPSIAPALVEHLLDRAAADPEALCVLCSTDRGLEPLLSVWRPAAAVALDRAIAAGTTALREGIAAVPHTIVVEPDEWRRHDPTAASFANWNTPGDLP